MYEHFFKLTAEPFRLSPDHRFCYKHAQYSKAKAYMAYAFMRAEGFVMITGQPGTGKTTLIGDLVESLAGEDVVVANLVSTQLAADDLLRMVAFAFGLDGDAADKSMVLQQLSLRFLNLYREGGRALLIVDEAQDLNATALEELRLLTNLQQDGKPLLQIFLLGQPELRELVHDPSMEQVHQRIVAASHLRALEEDETRAYVEHRLRVVGWNNDPAISSAVFPIIYLFSEGVPRRINLICSRLFLHCCVEQRHQIAVADARTVVAELNEEQLSTRNILNEDLFLAEDVFDSPLLGEALVAATSVRASTPAPREQEQVPQPREESQDPSPAIQKVEPPREEDVPQKLEELPAKAERQPPVVSAVKASKDHTASVVSSKSPGSVGNKEAWFTLLAAILAGGAVALMAVRDRFL